MLAGEAGRLAREGGSLAYRVDGDGPLVVCIPGLGDVSAVYRKLAADLVRADYRVATMDLRGHGESDTTFDEYGAVATGGDVLALIDLLGGPAAIVGNSIGAGAGVWATAEQPAAVKGLVLIGPFVRDLPMSLGRRLLVKIVLRRPWGPAFWERYLRSLYPTRPPADLADHRREFLAGLERPGGWEAFVATAGTSHAPVTARLAEVHTPTLVIMGEKDADYPDPKAEAEWVARQLGSEVLLVPDAGHYPQAEFPEVTTPGILDFLKRLHSGAG